MNIVRILPVILAFLFPAAVLVGADAPTLTADEKGVQIDAGSAGKFLLPVPRLGMGADDYKGEIPAIEYDGGQSVTGRYPSGAEIRISVNGARVECEFKGVPEGAKGFMFHTQIPLRFNSGGQFRLGDNSPQPFPEQQEKQLVGQGTAAQFTLLDGSGAGFRVVTPKDYQQVQDNRIFGAPVFVHILNYTFNNHGGKTAFSLAFEPPDATPNALAQAAPASSGAGAAPTLALTEKGAAIQFGAAGGVTIPVPGLSLGETDYSGEKPSVEKQGDALVARYPSGAELRMSVSGGDTISCSFQGVPESARGFVFHTPIPINFSQGGRFILGNKPPADFPEQKEKQIVQDGWAQSFSVISPSGEGYTLAMPGEYQQVQDNRVFNWPVFMHIYSFNFKNQAGKTSFAFKVGSVKSPDAATSTASSEPRKILVDRYGQSTRKDYPGKVKSDDELRTDGVKQLEEQAAFKPDPKLDAYGGLAGSGETYGLKKTGFFHIGKAEERDVLVTPDGNAFFQLSACGITNTDDYTTVKGREKIYEWIPPKDEKFGGAWRPNTPGAASFFIANWIRKFDKPYDKEEWLAQVVTRLRSWGFNSSGAFSGNPEAFRAMNFPNVAFLPLGEYDGVKTLPARVGAQKLLDPFVPGVEETLDKKFAEKVAARANDPLLIGYFLGNEQHFELLPKVIPSYKASEVAAKAKLADILEKKYGGDIAKFNAAWQPAKPFADWQAVREEPLFIRSDAGAADMKEFYELYLETYFSMVERVFRKHDPNHLLIGSRLTPGTSNNEPAVRISGKYTDVNSINYYTYPIDANFLKKFHEWSGKPVIFSEWYYSSTDHGLNGGKEVRDQAERGKAYRNYVEQSAALPFVVGSQWFIYGDQSITGRFFEGFNGEGANTGLVDVADRPYPELVTAAKETHGRIYDVMFGKEKPFAYEDPRFHPQTGGANARVVTIPKALPGLKVDGTTNNWPPRPAEPIESARVVQGNPNPALRGDFRLCWDEKNLYFLIQVKDPTPLKNNKQGDRLWNADGVELFIGAKDPGQPGSMLFSDRQILIGASDTPKFHIADHPEDSAKCQSLVVKDVTGDGYVLQTVIPWEVLGITPKPGLELLFDVMIDNSDDGDMRKEQLAWNGTASNSQERGGWGRAKLLEN